MDRTRTNPRRKPHLRLGGEQLESRALLTGGGGNLFALVPGQITQSGGTASHTFVLEKGPFTSPRGGLTLGIDIAPVNGSTVQAKIQKVTASAVSAATAHKPSAAEPAVQRTGQNTAVLVKLPVGDKATFTTAVEAAAGTQGNYVLGYYLPGDVNGDGQVTGYDLGLIADAFGTTSTSQNYAFDADSNRDGVINKADLAIAQKNKGASTTIVPAISANLAPISDSGAADRVTIYKDVIFEGSAAPGARITYSEIGKRTPDVVTTASADGTYEITVSLAEGTNLFRVTAEDAFGQVISGTIAPINYDKPETPVASPTKTTAPSSDSDPPQYAKFVKAHPRWAQANPDQAAKLRERLLAQQQNRTRRS